MRVAAHIGQGLLHDSVRAAGVSAVVGVDDGFVGTTAYDSRQVTATVFSGGPAELDRASTALTGLTPDQ